MEFFLENLMTSHNIWKFPVISFIDTVVTWLKTRFYETSCLMTPHSSDGCLLTPHTGTFNKISPIMVSLSIKSYRTDLVSFTLGVVKHEILDIIGNITRFVSYRVSWDLLNETTMHEILLKALVCILRSSDWDWDSCLRLR